ncbi:hypothetical protein BSR28_01910 [Boudabousia liubingyangii]|uniref:hypothetical protein n=1 Tax=Boudabousia liubingyangii TaxID=1921764 RepID=UPI00093E6F84|nr:hypothetical protein [Boudabousia liubingyangii]OKL48475.1 hypothetical protein BSR28_01910 [Boudabousia liubingyangii]
MKIPNYDLGLLNLKDEDALAAAGLPEVPVLVAGGGSYSADPEGIVQTLIPKVGQGSEAASALLANVEEQLRQIESLRRWIGINIIDTDNPWVWRGVERHGNPFSPTSANPYTCPANSLQQLREEQEIAQFKQELLIAHGMYSDLKQDVAALLQRTEKFSAQLYALSGVFEGAESQNQRWFYEYFGIFGHGFQSYTAFSKTDPALMSQAVKNMSSDLMNNSFMQAGSYAFAFGDQMLKPFGMNVGDGSPTRLLVNDLKRPFGAADHLADIRSSASSLAHLTPLMGGKNSFKNGIKVRPLPDLMTVSKPPQDTAELIRTMSAFDQQINAQHLDRKDHGHILILKHENQLGTSWSVIIPGTQSWVGGDSPQDLTTNLKMAAGEGSAQSLAVLKSMQAAGIKADEPVELLGHSQGGGIVQQLAANPQVKQRFNIKIATTLGSPTVIAGYPAGVKALSLRGSRDIVTALGGTQLAPAKNHLVIAGTPTADKHFHLKPGYQQIMDQAQKQHDPNLAEHHRNRRRALHLDQAETKTTVFSFETIRTEDGGAGSIDQQVESLKADEAAVREQQTQQWR